MLALVVVANTFNIGADLGAMAASVRLLVQVPLIVGVAVFAVGMTALEVLVPYRRYAKALRWLVLSLIVAVTGRSGSAFTRRRQSPTDQKVGGSNPFGRAN